MLLSFIRHGESVSNAQQIFSSDKRMKNGLTNKGTQQIKSAAKTLQDKVDFIYTSPFQRAIESAEIFIQNRPEELSPSVNEHIREINYGKYAEKKNGPEMDAVSKRQVAGDYEVRFGETGENKREIITRLYLFLLEMLEKHKPTDSIVVFSHGRVISILELVFGDIKGDSYRVSSTKNAEIKQFTVDLEDKDLFIQAVNKLNRGAGWETIRNKFNAARK